jgi:hypothetical protein
MTFLIDNGWAVFLLVGLVLLVFGSRRGRVRRENGTVAIAPNLVSRPLISAGITVLALGGVFGLAVAIAKGNPIGVVMSIITPAIYAFVAYTILRVQRRTGAASR